MLSVVQDQRQYVARKMFDVTVRCFVSHHVRSVRCEYLVCVHLSVLRETFILTKPSQKLYNNDERSNAGVCVIPVRL
jgi:hypothetical protein